MISTSPPPTHRIRCTRAPPSPPRTKQSALDTGTPLFMRAPGEATGSIALESAIDEAAWACGMDPLAFRLKNYAEVEPISGKPFSSKALRECYAQGAERFGWARRPLAPRQMRDEAGLLVGWGVGTATFPALMFAGRGARGVAQRRLRHDGDRRPRHGPGRLDRARPDRGRRPGARRRPDGVQVGHVRPAGRGHRRRLGPHRHRRHGDPQCGRGRYRQTRRPRHRRRALAPVRRRQRRRDRARRPPVPSRRRKSQRELWRYSRARRPCADRGQRQGRRRSRGAIDLRHARPRRGFRRGQGRSRSRPDPRQPHGRRVRRGAGHQSPHGAAARSLAA